MYPIKTPPALQSQAPFPPWGGKGARSLNTTPSSAPSTTAQTVPPVIAASVVLPGWLVFRAGMMVLICLMTSAITAKNARKWVSEKRVLTRAHWDEDIDVLQNSFGLRLANSTVCFSHFPVRDILKQPW